MTRIRTHPGEVLWNDCMMPLGLSATKLAEEIGVPAKHITDIVAGRRPVTGDMPNRLAKRFGTTSKFWVNLQKAHDVSIAGARPAVKHKLVPKSA